MRRIFGILLLIFIGVLLVFAAYEPARNAVYPILTKSIGEPAVMGLRNFVTWLGPNMFFIGIPIGAFAMFLLYTGFIRFRRWGIRSAEKDTFVPTTAPMPVTATYQPAPTATTPAPAPTPNPTTTNPETEETKK